MQAESVLKLGKELTCPICLGLLKSAVHLPCNHCFCRGCIQQSILTKASCPVCKKPAHKRDLRPAASVDQVVAAYAEMERALGVQILCSQPAKPPPADDTEKETQGKRKKPKSKMQRIAEEGKENEVPRASAQAEKLGEEGRVVFVQKKDAFKAPKNVAQKAQQTARPGDAKLGAGLVACGGSKQNRKEIETTPAGSNMLAAGKAKKKASKKKAVAKVDAPNEGATFSPPLPALAESAPTPDQRSVGVSPGGSGFQPFFWTGGQVGTQDPEGGTQLRPTQASPPISFSDLVSSGKKGAKSLKEDTPAPGGVVTGKKTDGREGAKAAKKGKKVTGGGAGKENGEKAAREEFYSCEDDTAFDAFLQEDGVGSPEASLPIAPSATGEAKGEQKNSGKGKKGGVKKGAKAPKRDAVKSRTESATESLAAPERAKLKAEIRASVAAAVGATQTLSGSASHDARLTAGGEGKVTSAEEKVTSASERKPKQRAPAAGKRKRGSVAETADASEATGVSAVLTGVNAAAAPSTTPHVSKKPAGEIGKTPSVPAKTPGLKTPADNGLCPSTSRPLDSGGPPVFCEKPACGFCGLSDDSDVAGKLVRKGAAPIGLLAAEGFEERGADNESGGKRKRVQLASVVVHELCAQWAPNVFFEGEDMANLDSELARSRQLKCSVCSRRGAALGCFLPRCRHTYHFACSRQLEGCRFDEESYVMLCPDHASEKLPFEIDEPDGSDREEAPANGKGGAKKRKAAESARAPKRPKTAPSVEAAPASMKWAGAPGAKWVLTGSGLSPTEKDDLALLAHSSGAQVVKDWSPVVTHVITGVDDKRRSKRTLKYLTAVLTGQWVVTPEWVTESLAHSQPAKEPAFEVLGDAQNETGGPKKGRMAARKGAAPLFDGIDFFLSGDWPGTPSKADMAAVVSAGGGTVLARRPLPNEAAPAPSSKSHKPPKTVILYFGGQPHGSNAPPGGQSDGSFGRRAEALGLSGSAGKDSVVVHHRWLLDSASAFQLQDSSKYE